MTLPRFDRSSGVSGAILADQRGRVLAHATSPELARAGAIAAMTAVRALAAAGEVVGFSRLEVLVVKSAREATATALRGDQLLVAALDPARPAAPAEKALDGWALSPGAVAGRAPRPARPPGTPPLPRAVATSGRAVGGVAERPSECEQAFATLGSEMSLARAPRP